jgi:hypothetical protein
MHRLIPGNNSLFDKMEKIMCKCTCKNGKRNISCNCPKKTPHVHAELIKAWADGAEMEVKVPSRSGWHACPNPSWVETYEYRIKLEPKPDVMVYAAVHISHPHRHITVYSQSNHNWAASGCPSYTKNPDIKFIFDGETGELKSVCKI